MSAKRESRTTPEWRAYYREYYKKNGDRIRAHKRISQRAHYRKNYEKYKAAQAEYYANNRERIIERNCAYGRQHVVRKLLYDKQKQLSRYGLTVEEFDAWSARIEGRCEICRRLPGGRHKRLGVDHCHKTGVVRGLLCTRCNTALGGFGDSVETLQIAIRYLQAAQAKESAA